MTVTALPRPRTRPRAWRKQLLPYVLMAPCVVLVLGFLLYPLADEIYLSLTRWSLLSTPQPIFVGPSIYGQLLGDGVFWGSLWRSCIWTAGTLVVQFVIGLPLALALNHRTRLTGVATGLVLLPWVTPTVVVSYAWTWILDSQFGILDAVLRTLHLVGNVSPLASYGSALPTVTIVSGWKGTPFMAIMLLATLKGIPAELYEAAQVDGAGFLQRHLRITLPALRKTALVAGMLLGIWAFYSFDFAWLMTQGGPGDATELAGIYLFKMFQYNLNWSYAADIGMAMFAILAVVLVVYLRVAQPTKE
jgi:multiple sugar transport system permease protein